MRPLQPWDIWFERELCGMSFELYNLYQSDCMPDLCYFLLSSGSGLFGYLSDQYDSQWNYLLALPGSVQCLWPDHLFVHCLQCRSLPSQQSLLQHVSGSSYHQLWLSQLCDSGSVFFSVHKGCQGTVLPLHYSSYWDHPSGTNTEVFPPRNALPNCAVCCYIFGGVGSLDCLFGVRVYLLAKFPLNCQDGVLNWLH